MWSDETFCKNELLDTRKSPYPLFTQGKDAASAQLLLATRKTAPGIKLKIQTYGKVDYVIFTISRTNLSNS